MTFRRRLHSTPLHLAILRAAAWLVPAPQRAEWFAEWSAELWYVERGATLFCLGSFRDAFWLKRHSAATPTHRAFGLESPVRCVLLLAGLATASVCLALCLPSSREMFRPSPYRDARNLALVSAYPGAPLPSIRLEQYQWLANRMQDRFAGLAFYRPVPEPVATAPHTKARLWIAVASANLFQLLEIPLPFGAQSQHQSAARLVLSLAAWRKHFASDPHIMGRVLEVAGRPAVVSGVIDAHSWRLPGYMDAWLLQNPSDLAELPADAIGFVVGRIRISPSQPRPDRRWSLSLPNERGGYDRLACSPIGDDHLALACLGMGFLSLVLLSTLTPLGLGEYPANRYAPTGATRLRRWIFLGVKIALVLPITWCGALDVASALCLPILPHLTLVAWIAGLRWVLIDQRQRCPVCLRRLTHPTRIGGASQVFLEWYGTELICDHGHGLLYVPEIPTSYYGTQRWQYLDPSWSSLFT